MSLSKKYDAYDGKLSFAEWKVLYLRLEQARKARGSSARKPVAAKAVKAQTFERVSNRVDCFAVKGSTASMACDTADMNTIKGILKNACVVGQQYTSKRGERTRFSAPVASVSKLERKGFAVKGL